MDKPCPRPTHIVVKPYLASGFSLKRQATKTCNNTFLFVDDSFVSVNTSYTPDLSVATRFLFFDDESG
jgi:hypothetical protein